jgi:hypothetical protein
MKDSWLLYDYLRRWWLLLLAGSVLGAAIGLSYYSTQEHPVEYIVTADLIITDPEYTGEGSPPRVTLAQGPIDYASSEEAIEGFRSRVADFANNSDVPVLVRRFSIDIRTVDPSWKAAVLGGVFGTLMVIGGVYTWEDARAELRSQQIGDTNK